MATRWRARAAEATADEIRREDAEAFVHGTARHCGRIDILVNNASSRPAAAPAINSRDESVEPSSTMSGDDLHGIFGKERWALRMAWVLL